jgi:hypothetical protein
LLGSCVDFSNGGVESGLNFFLFALFNFVRNINLDHFPQKFGFILKISIRINISERIIQRVSIMIPMLRLFYVISKQAFRFLLLDD